jgi:hypothetical protein
MGDKWRLNDKHYKEDRFMEWYLIERAYGEYEIIGSFKTKHEAMVYNGYISSTKIRKGVYEVQERHLIIKGKDTLINNGYELN